jgi:hypothetical protein
MIANMFAAEMQLHFDVSVSFLPIIIITTTITIVIMIFKSLQQQHIIVVLT